MAGLSESSLQFSISIHSLALIHPSCVVHVTRIPPAPFYILFSTFDRRYGPNQVFLRFRVKSTFPLSETSGECSSGVGNAIFRVSPSNAYGVRSDLPPAGWSR